MLACYIRHVRILRIRVSRCCLGVFSAYVCEVSGSRGMLVSLMSFCLWLVSLIIFQVKISNWVSASKRK